MKVNVDKSGCISCGVCVQTCPEIFRMDSDGLAEAYAQPAPDQEDCARDAALNCPVSVIEITE